MARVRCRSLGANLRGAPRRVGNRLVHWLGSGARKGGVRTAMVPHLRSCDRCALRVGRVGSSGTRAAMGDAAASNPRGWARVVWKCPVGSAGRSWCRADSLRSSDRSERHGDLPALGALVLRGRRPLRDQHMAVLACVASYRDTVSRCIAAAGDAQPRQPDGPFRRGPCASSRLTRSSHGMRKARPGPARGLRRRSGRGVECSQNPSARRSWRHEEGKGRASYNNANRRHRTLRLSKWL